MYVLGAREFPAKNILKRTSSGPTKSVNKTDQKCEEVKSKSIFQGEPCGKNMTKAVYAEFFFHAMASVEGRRNNNQCLAVSNTYSYICRVSPLTTVD